jgi:hypothetical protein
MGRRDTLRFWFDGNESNVESLKQRFVSHIREKHLIVGQEFFTVKYAPLIRSFCASIASSWRLTSFPWILTVILLGLGGHCVSFAHTLLSLSTMPPSRQEMTGAQWLIAADAWFSDLPPTH